MKFRLSAALSVARYNIHHIPYVLSSCYDFVDGISIVYTSPFPSKEDVELINWYISQFPGHEKKVKFREIPWYYPNKQAARSRGYLTTNDVRFVGIAGPETQSCLDALMFLPHRIIYGAGDQVYFEHWQNIKPWIKQHWHINPVLRCHIVNYYGPDLIASSVTNPIEYEDLIARVQDQDAQVAIIEPGVVQAHTEGAVYFNDVPVQTQPVIRTLVMGHFREWTPLANPSDVRFKRQLDRIRIRNMNEEYPTVLTEDEEYEKAKRDGGSGWTADGGIPSGSTGYDLLTPPKMPLVMYSKQPWEFVGQGAELGKNAWQPNLFLRVNK